MLTQLHFCAIGFGYSVCANKVYMVLSPTTSQSRKMIKESKSEGRWVDATHRRPIRSLILMDDNRLIGCAFSTTTILNRLIRSTEDFTSMIPPVIEEEEEDYDDEFEEEEEGE